MATGIPSYFTLSEMTRTSTGLSNTPATWEQVENLRTLGLFLDLVRTAYGKPIRVNCAFRSPEVNAKVGGVATSTHLKGLAADICAASGKEEDNRKLLKILDAWLNKIDQLISYHVKAGNLSSTVRFIHVGLTDGDRPRGQRLCK